MLRLLVTFKGPSCQHRFCFVSFVQARRFLEDGNMLRLVVTFKGGAQIALGRDVVLYLIGQLSGACRYGYCCAGLLLLSCADS